MTTPNADERHGRFRIKNALMVAISLVILIATSETTKGGEPVRSGAIFQPVHASQAIIKRF